MAEPSPKKQFDQEEPSVTRWKLALKRNFDDWARVNAEKHDIKRRARENGRNNLPLTDDKDLDVVQRQIEDSYRSGAESIHQALWNRLRGAHDLIYESIPQELNPEPIRSRASTLIAALRESARNELVSFYLDEREAWRDLKLFKGEHGLARGASYPKPRPPMFVVSAVLAAVIVESVMNGLIFRDINPGYTVGGTLQALAFSVVNVFLGYFALGFAAARFTTHRDSGKRRLAWAGVIVMILLGLMWNLYVAHWREAAAEAFARFNHAVSASQTAGIAPPDISTLLVDAGAHMFRSGFALSSWSAIVLLVVGLMIFVGLATEGYHGWDDSYPGYGRVDRAHKDARVVFERRVAVLREGINSRIAGVAGEIGSRLQMDESKVETAREIESQAQLAGRIANDSVTDLARSSLQNLRDYREANTYVRPTNPPGYFNDYPELELKMPEDPEIPYLLTKAEEALARNRTIKSSFDAKLDQWAQEEADNLAKFLVDVRREATFRADHERRGSLYVVESPNVGEAPAGEAAERL